jgi:hypothetical protein
MSYETDRAAYQKAFDLVCNPKDWREPIDRILDPRAAAKALGIENPGTAAATSGATRVIREAVIFFTAIVPEFTWEGSGLLRVTASGYRAGPAGDH